MNTTLKGTEYMSHLCRYAAIFLTINLSNSNMISNFATTLNHNLEHYEY